MSLTTLAGIEDTGVIPVIAAGTPGRHRADHDERAGKIAALIPTCNEPEIAATIRSVWEQSLPPDYVVVVVNNCTDDTEDRARAAGATVIRKDHNSGKKAGALNFGYSYIRRELRDVEYVVQMDADTVLEHHFIERTYDVMRTPKNWNVGALSSAFIAKDGLPKNWRQAIMMWPQAAEYMRYQDSAIRSDVSCISGTGNMLRVEALDELKAKRGKVWRTDTLVEDFELTLALAAGDWECRKSKKFIVYTDLMPSVRALWRQRLRWQRGTIDELRRYGWTGFTRWDWAKQIIHGLLMLLHIGGLGFCVYSIVRALLGQHDLRFSTAIGVCLGAIALKQAYHLREMGWRSVLVALTIVPEELYNMLRHGWWLRGLWLSLRRKDQSW